MMFPADGLAMASCSLTLQSESQAGFFLALTPPIKIRQSASNGDGLLSWPTNQALNWRLPGLKA